MGCGASSTFNSAVAPASAISFEDILAMNIQLDKWTYQQIVLARSRFMAGLSKRNPHTLDLAGFRSVFPSLARLPEHVAVAAFRLFDKDSSNDIDLKEFCYTLSPLVYGSLEEQQNFAYSLFEIDQNSKVDLKGLKLALASFEAIRQNISAKELPDQELSTLSKEAEKMMGEKKLLSMEEFVDILESRISLESLMEIFEVIPSPANEYKAINELMIKDFTDKPQQPCHIISYKWWNMWLNFAKKGYELQNSGTKGSQGTLSRSESVPNVSHNIDSAGPKRIDTGKRVLQKSELERPGEIDNTDIEGTIKGTLKDGLRYLNDYTYIPKNAWEHLYEWYGGGPEFERVLIAAAEGKRAVELYPPILYAKVANETSTYSYVPFVISKTSTIEQAIRIIKAKFCKSKEESRLWYRFNVVNSVWELADDPSKTIDEYGLNHGDKLILELKTIAGWARDKIPKEDLQWEPGERLDIYCQRTEMWKEGTIMENRKSEIVVQLEKYNMLTVQKTSSLVAPYRKHTVHSIQNVVTPDVRKKLDNEFKPLSNLGNT